MFFANDKERVPQSPPANGQRSLFRAVGMRHSFARLQSRVVSDVTIPALRPLISSRRERALQPGLTIGEILLKRDPAKPALADEELQDRDRRREATGRTAAYTALSVWIDNSLSFSA